MVDNPTQSNRIGELITPLGKDKLLLSSFTAHEELSRPFEVRIECVSKDEDIDFSKSIGQNCTIRLNTVGKKKRYFSGIMVEASWFGERDGMSAYQVVLRPWLWLLSQTSDCRIFQNMKVDEIIRKVFTKSGFNDFEMQLSGNYKPIEYCVQYRESHFDFVSRLMEAYGIYYYFKHTQNKHMLVLGDSRSSHKTIPDLPQCKFAGMGDRTRDNEEYVTTWRKERRFRTGKVAINAFDFSKPAANLLTEKTISGGYSHDQMEIYLYPFPYKRGDEQTVGLNYAETRLTAMQALDKRRYATGDAPSLFPGGLVKLTKFPTASEDGEYLVVGATHTFVGESYSTGDTSASGDSYRGSYVLLPSSQPYKAPQITPKPIISGPQTAIVCGPKGEEIYTDEHGRVKLKFHWDRDSKGDEKSSRWVRVSQMWAAKGWGGIVIPRIGMEAVVEFIEGDPDRPIVVGTVYNGDNTVPYELPANKTQSGFKTRSSKGANDSKFNELVFEDAKDKECITLHAEKDFKSIVEDTDKRVIEGKNNGAVGDTTREVRVKKGDDVHMVDTGDHKVTIGNDETIDVTNNQTITVGKNILIKAGDSITLEVGASKIVMTKGKIDISTGTLNVKSVDATIKADLSLTQKSAIIKLN